MSYGINPQESGATGNASPSASGATPSQPQYAPPAGGAGVNPYGIQGYPTGSQPGEQVNFVGAIKNFFRKYTQFSGRASRSEYWWAFLAQSLLALVMAVVYVMAAAAVVSSADPITGEPSGGAVAFALLILLAIGLIALALIVPNIAVVVRRLHDTNRSGWYYFINFVPLVGPIILLVFLAGEPDPAGAAFDA
ncbi:DUF805 domain-containing protein [Kocuria sp.]|uniref:DUF805 domain-containing protein n=1 Tax=Kocuria sp. TaxID=1871328 RepID=UPI0026E0253B|nr:DUF805 domain-containing protein [Kocuria sp.]MDO5619193.1 DUF805 domain-containing protein [Kocuria sp.]